MENVGAVGFGGLIPDHDSQITVLSIGELSIEQKNGQGHKLLGAGEIFPVL